MACHCPGWQGRLQVPAVPCACHALDILLQVPMHAAAVLRLPEPLPSVAAPSRSRLCSHWEPQVSACPPPTYIKR